MAFLCFLSFPSPSYGKELSYKVNIKGVEDDDLKIALQDSSNLIQLKEKPLSSPSGLILRARDDKNRLLNVLKSYGFYSGKMDIKIEEQSVFSMLPSGLPDKDPLEITIEIETGPVYSFGQIQVKGLDQSGLQGLKVELQPGDPARGQSVLDAERGLVSRIKLAGYPYVRSGKRKVRVNHQKKTMDVLYEIDPGPSATLGDLSISGLQAVKENFIYNRAPWEEGDEYDPRILERFRSDLTGLGVFSSVKLRIPEKLDLKGEEISQPLPVQLDVEEREPRFFGVGGDFSTNEGIGLNAFWGHRNFFGEAEKVRIKARLARIGENDFDRIDQKLGLDFQKPDFLVRRQNLLFNAELANEHPDAFERQSISSTLGLNRPLSKTLSVNGGIGWEFSSIEDADGKGEFALFSFPMGLKHDTTKNLLDPKSGFRNELSVTPFTVAAGTGTAFTKFRAGSRAYYKAAKDGSVVLAARFLLGSIVGPATDQIPADKRFFAGGGGSVRGYQFQNVGPLDNSNNPLGGRSLIEVGVEARFRYKDFGFVPFIDGGNVFDSQLPQFDEDLRWGAGLGLRYYTTIGPLRVDLAAPLNRRANDDPVAFYISIGQSF
ncbi:MAG: membrane protein [Nitrospinaceae bacterium]|nr:MAG: membrane protein [Nitrospinaceae bacterium]